MNNNREIIATGENTYTKSLNISMQQAWLTAVKYPLQFY